jgi:hypothetical protein
MACRGCNPLADEPEEWIPDPTQHKWFRHAITLVTGQIMPSPDGSLKVITFDAFDALCEQMSNYLSPIYSHMFHG